MFTRRYCAFICFRVFYSLADAFLGVVFQAGLPPHHVLLLSLQHDRGFDPRRVVLSVVSTADSHADPSITWTIRHGMLCK
jgi:hypothetical protein